MRKSALALQLHWPELLATESEETSPLEKAYEAFLFEINEADLQEKKRELGCSAGHAFPIRQLTCYCGQQKRLKFW